MAALVEPLIDTDVFQIQCLGVHAGLSIDQEQGLLYRPAAASSARRRWSCCPTRPQHRLLQIPLWQIAGAAKESPDSLRVWYFQPCKEKGSSSSSIQQAPRFKLKKTLPFVCSSGTEAAALVQRVRQLAAWQGQDKPPQVVAIVNPSSGQRRAVKLFRQQVLPVLEDAAGMDVTVLMTQHPGHATSIVAELSLDGLNCLVFVGGDGTVHEGLQGLLSRQDWAAARLLPIAHIPGGSGNGVAHSCGLHDPASAALAICKAQVSPMDVASVLQPPHHRRYMLLLATFGMMSNLDVGTERIRWLGDTRFTLGALWEILKLQSYNAAIAWLPGEEPAAAGAADAADADTAAPGLAAAVAASSSSTALLSGSVSGSCAHDVLPVSTSVHSVTSPAAAQHGSAASVSLQDFQPGPELPLLSQLGGRLPLAVPTEASQLGSGWRVWHAPLQMWCLVNPPFISARCKMNPRGHLDGGQMNMMMVEGLAGLRGRLTAMDLQIKSEHGLHTEAPCLMQHTVRALIFQPLDGATCLQLDGEVIPSSSPIFLEVHQGLIRVVINPAPAAAAAAPA